MRTLLIVDDNPSIRVVLSQCLERKGFHVSSADSGVEAVTKTEGSNFDAVIMDINMPQLSGIDACDRILKRDPLPRPLIWLMTGLWSPEVEEAGLRAGAHEVLAKPFNTEYLLSRLQAGWAHQTSASPA